MTANLQISWKLDNGAILVVGAENKQEFKKLLEDLGLYEVTKGHIQAIASGSVATSNVNTGEIVWDVLPSEAVLEIVWKGDKYHGEISPFPNTKFPVWVWPEVLGNAQWFHTDARTFNVGGLKVGYTLNEKGYPAKVVSWGADTEAEPFPYDDSDVPF